MIPYRTYPEVDLGPVSLHTFGLLVALGILVGSLVMLRHGRRLGLDTDDLSRMAFWVVVLGLVGARVMFVFTHASSFADRPLGVFAVWEGGLQFSGGFLAAAAVLAWWFRRHPRIPRLALLDGVVLGLVPGLAIGRIGCYLVGEHLGGPTSFPLAVHYLGGVTREGPIPIGASIHNTSLYELLLLWPLFGALLWLRRRGARPGSLLVAFLLGYGIQRFATDFLRAYDRTALGLTGAQWMCLGLILAGMLLLGRLRAGPPRAASASSGAAA